MYTLLIRDLVLNFKLKGLSMGNIVKENIATVETFVFGKMKEFLELNEVILNEFVGKVIVTDRVATMQLGDGEADVSSELTMVILSDKPETKGQPVYSNLVTFTDDVTVEGVLELVDKSFPTAEEIAKQKEAAEAEVTARQAAQDNMAKSMEGLMPKHLLEGTSDEDMAKIDTTLEDEVDTNQNNTPETDVADDGLDVDPRN